MTTPVRRGIPSVVEKVLEDQAAFPPLWVSRLFAYALSLATFPLLVVWFGFAGGDLEGRTPGASLLFLGGLISAWLSSIWTGQGHLDHATAAFVLSAGLVVATLLVTF